MIKTPPKRKPKPKPLTPIQEAYVNEKMMGRPPSVLLGRSAEGCAASETVQRELAIQQRILAEEVQISRRDVVEGILAAINRAKLQAEPATEIAGWREVGKILGHYAPETKKVMLTDDQDKIVRKLESMSTAELLQMVERKRIIRQGATIDGESKQVPTV